MRLRYAQDDWFDAALLNALPDDDEFVNPTLNTALERAVRLDPLPLFLRVEDRNAMAHSVEARLPFLDPGLVEFAFGLPPEWKMHGPWNKRILRESMAGRIPENARTRPDKMGFPTPFSDWLRNELYPAAIAVLNDPAFNTDGLFRVEAIRRDLVRHRRGTSTSPIGFSRLQNLPFGEGYRRAISLAEHAYESDTGWQAKTA